MKLQVITGSTRPGRVTNVVSTWVAEAAKQMDGVEVEIVDLQDYDMPLFNEPVSPQYNPNREPEEPVAKWLEKIGDADAYVLVTPEYNRSMPAVLKNAIDYIDFQFAKKPIALVGHGSTGGAQAIASLRMALPGLLAITVPSAVFLTGRVNEMIDDSGALKEELKSNPYGPQTALKGVLELTKWYSDALSTARAKN